MSLVKNAHFQKIYAENFKFILSVLRKFPALDSEAEDIIHDVFVKFHHHMDKIAPGKERGWLIVSARNAALDRLRQKKSRKTEVTGDEMPDDSAMLWESDSAHELRIGVISHLMDDFIKSEGEGASFSRFYREGKSLREIAEESNVPIGTVAARIYRMREKFRDRLRKQLDEM